MDEKEYYRLDELNTRFDVTFDDVRYWVEEGKLKLAFHVSNKRFVLGGWQDDNGFIAFGIASYKGLVSISANEQLKLIEKDSIKCSNFTLLQKSNITQLESEYPFKAPIPNKLIAEWRPKSLDQIIWDVIPAKLCPKEQENGLKVAGQSLLKMFAKMGKQSNPNVAVDTSAYDKIADYQFLYTDIEFTHQDICIQHQDLESLSIISAEVKPTNQVKVAIESLSTKDSRSNDFHDLIRRILTFQPSLSAKKIWILLEKECQLSEGERQYDLHNILRDAFNGEIYWVSIHQNDNYFKFSSLAPTLTKIRKSLPNNV